MTRPLTIACVLLLLLPPLGAWAAGSVPTPEPPAAMALFARSLTGLDDKPVALGGFRGRPLVVNFWARWCPPCIDEIPDLVKTRLKFKARGVEVVGIALDDSTALVRAFAARHHMNYPILLARDQGFDLMQQLGNSSLGLPFTVVLDRHGRIVARKLGRLSRSEMEAAFAAAAD